MVLSPEKGRSRCTDKEIGDAETLIFKDLPIKNSKEVQILRITLDRNMNFIIILKVFAEKQPKN